MSSRRLSRALALRGSGAGGGGGSVLSSQPPPFLPLLPLVGENWFYYDYFFSPFADLEEGCVREAGEGERGEDLCGLDGGVLGTLGCGISGLDFALFKADLGP